VKELWLKIEPSAPAKEKLLKLATEVSDIIVEDSHATRLCDKSDIQVLGSFNEAEITRLKHQGKTLAVRITIKGKEDENNAVKAAELSVDYIILNCLDWRIIPIENLIAKTRGKSRLIAEVSNAADAQLVLEALELGTDGVLLRTSDPDELAKTIALVKKQASKIQLVPAKITAVKQIGTGARVCVDTCDLMVQGEGMLVGCQASGLFLVEAEVTENPYVQSRPFRVNAGSLPLYTLASLQSTRYLSELKAGDEVLIVDREGNARTTNVGRAKIEFRPLILIEAEAQGKKLKAILQNAETIRLVTKSGSTPVTELKAGNEVLVHLATAKGRHFGIAVPDETVIER
jgi:3-dehydroquinate synthase II